jgi:hypothetical protein
LAVALGSIRASFAPSKHDLSCTFLPLQILNNLRHFCSEQFKHLFGIGLFLPSLLLNLCHLIVMSTVVEEKFVGTPVDVEKSVNSTSTEEHQPARPQDLDIETAANSDGLYQVKDTDAGLKLAKDGSTVLIPQPTDDNADPLNWSWLKKHKAFFALLLPSLLTDWGMTWGTTMFEAQAGTWHMSVPDVARSTSGGIFLQGPGGILAVPLIQRYGR